MFYISSLWVVITLLLVVIFSASFFFAGIAYRKNVAEKQVGQAETVAKKIVEDAKKEADVKAREVTLRSNELIEKRRNEFDREMRENKSELQRLERRLIQKEEFLDKKAEKIEEKEEILNEKQQQLIQLETEVTNLKEKANEELQQISGMTREEAKDMLLKSLEEEVKHDAAIMVKDIESKAKDEADKKAKVILANSIQRYAADQVAEMTVSVVALPNDEMKGRIIGREGRNIRTLETLTGIDLIIDDTPEAVILSGFDPIRREIARIALERLIVDGRIHPARIEEMVEKAKKEVETSIKEDGEKAAFELGVHGLHNEIIKLLGKLKFRTSYGQNVLNHSIEVAYISGMIAAELGLDVKLARRAGLLHDIGKAVDHELEGSHVSIGVDIAKKYRESSEIINAIASHHGDTEPNTLIAVIVQAADTISAARPGSRRETLQTYTKRLEKLEEIVNSFTGVGKSYAIQAGREVRIMVKPEEVNDSDTVLIARDIAKKIESELEYPGQIKVNLIRETRVVEYAK